MALPIAHAWCKQHFGDRLIAVIDPSLEVLLRRANLPLEIWVVSKKERGRLVQLLKTQRPTTAFIMTNSLGSLWPYAKARVSKRIGFGGKLTRYLLTDRGGRSLLSLPQGERWFSLLKLEPLASKTPSLIQIHRTLNHLPQLLVFPGAKYGPAKQWDMASYAEFIRLCQQKGWEVILMGTPAEKEDTEKIQQYLEQPVKNLCGTLSLSALLDYVSTLSRPVVLANDSGAMHLLAACGVPTLGLYFSTSARNTPPAFGPYRVLEAQVPCRPCYARQCPYRHYECRAALRPNIAMAVMEDFLREHSL